MEQLTIDQTDDAPPFEQAKQQLIDQIVSRRLPPGTKLPTVRALAADLGLAVNTVARTYRELEAEGYVETRGRAGTVVSNIAAIDEESLRRAAELASDFVAAMRKLRLGDEAISAAVRRAL